MATVVVTGATGTLGRVLVPALLDAGHDVRAMTRTPGSISTAGAREVVADVRDAAWLAAACTGADVVVHLATSPGRGSRRTEVDGTRNVLAARGDAQLIYVSIVGCDRTPFAYYRAKTAAEQLVRGDGQTVVRATQFHSLVRTFLAPRVAGRAVAPAGLRLQPVAESFVAEVLVAAVAHPAAAPAEVGGPEELEVRELARRITGRAPLTLPLPVPLVRAVRRGSLLPSPGATLGGAPLPTATPA